VETIPIDAINEDILSEVTQVQVAPVNEIVDQTVVDENDIIEEAEKKKESEKEESAENIEEITSETVTDLKETLDNSTVQSLTVSEEIDEKVEDTTPVIPIDQQTKNDSVVDKSEDRQPKAEDEENVESSNKTSTGIENGAFNFEETEKIENKIIEV